MLKARLYEIYNEVSSCRFGINFLRRKYLKGGILEIENLYAKEILCS